MTASGSVIGSGKDRYLLTEGQSDRIFRERIVPELLDLGDPQSRPIAVLLGGQPGSGKSRVKAAILRELAARGGAVGLDGDDLRLYHPQYGKLLRADSRTAAYFTDLDAGRWLDKAMEFSRAGRVDVVVEGTMRRPEFVRSICGRFRGAGHRVEAAVLAAPEAVSRLGILLRYVRRQELTGSGRFTDTEIHDAGYRGLLDSADAIDRDRLVDAAAVYGRSGRLLYRNEADQAGGWGTPAGLRVAIEAERGRGWTFDETARFLRDHAEVAAELGSEWAVACDEVLLLARPLLDPSARLAVGDQANRTESEASAPSQVKASEHQAQAVRSADSPDRGTESQ